MDTSAQESSVVMLGFPVNHKLWDAIVLWPKRNIHFCYNYIYCSVTQTNCWPV